jgi:hypothetical protein
MQTQQACPICSATLSPHEARKGFLCSRAECRWKYRLLTPSQLCTVCTRPLSARMGKSPVCERVECNREFFVDRIARDKEAKQQTLERQVGVWLGDAMQEYVRHSDVMDAPDIAGGRTRNDQAIHDGSDSPAVGGNECRNGYGLRTLPR